MTITKNSPNLFNRFWRSSPRMSGLIPIDNRQKYVLNTAPHSTPVGETHYATLLTPVVVTIGPKRSAWKRKQWTNYKGHASSSLNFTWFWDVFNPSFARTQEGIKPQSPTHPLFLPSSHPPSLREGKRERVGTLQVMKRVLITCQLFCVIPTLFSDFLIKDEIHTPVNRIINLITVFFDVPRGPRVRGFLMRKPKKHLSVMEISQPLGYSILDDYGCYHYNPMKSIMSS